MNSNYLKLTEEKNALDSLEKAYYFIHQTKKEKIAWKWVILSVYLSLYGFAICTLKGTTPENVKRSDGKLISFGEAIKRCQKKEYMEMLVTSKVLKLSQEEKRSIETLRKTFRNNFVHYSPKTWFIDLSGMSDIINDCINAIKFLSLDSGNYTDLKNSEKREIEHLINKSRKILENKN